jgi:prophage tail gpP-like protein
VARRPNDTIVLETEAGATDRIHDLELVQDYDAVAHFSLTMGDDGAWQHINRIVYPGRVCRIMLNGRLIFTGRFEENDVPQDAASGSTAKVVARTKLADAHYASADPKTRWENVSIKDFLLSLYAPHGYTAADFLFSPETARNLITGEGKGLKNPVDLEQILGGKAKVQPPETTHACATRHLKRHHLKLWDAANGQLVVGKPNDTQAPTYRLQSLRGATSQANNILRLRRIRDWSEVASEVQVFGNVTNEDGDDVSLRGRAGDAHLAQMAAETGHFSRRVLLPIEGVKTQAKAEAQARRELSSRQKKKDAWEITVDGWTYWTGTRAIPYAIDTVADVDVQVVGTEAAGPYLIHRVARSVDTRAGMTTKLQLVAPGIIVA